MSRKVLMAVGQGDFDDEDLIRCTLGGRLHKRERDGEGGSVDGWKYVIHGHDTRGRPFYVCGKIKRDVAGRFFFFITAHERG